MRPVKISDEPLLKDLFYSLSDKSLYRRFMSPRKDVPHQQLQEFVVIDHSKEMTIVASVKTGDREEVVGLGQYIISETSHTAEVAFVVRDDYQGKGIGTELLSYLTYLAKRQGPSRLHRGNAHGESPNAPSLRKNGLRHAEGRGRGCLRAQNDVQGSRELDAARSSAVHGTRRTGHGKRCKVQSARETQSQGMTSVYRLSVHFVFGFYFSVCRVPCTVHRSFRAFDTGLCPP